MALFKAHLEHVSDLGFTETQVNYCSKHPPVEIWLKRFLCFDIFLFYLRIVVYSHPSPSHLLLSMGTNSLDLLTNINLIENKGG